MYSTKLYGHHPGFSFDNAKRNNHLKSRKTNENLQPNVFVTGATIVGIVFKGGVIIGVDSRCTQNDKIPNANMSEVFRLTDHSIICGSGWGADVRNVAKLSSGQLDLHQKNMNRACKMDNITTVVSNILFRYKAGMMATFIIGGFDNGEPKTYVVGSNGTIIESPFLSAGPGNAMAMAILENRWKVNLSKEDAKTLVQDALSSGIKNHLKSGSTAKMWILEQNNIKMETFTKTIVEKMEKKHNIGSLKESTTIVSEKIEKINKKENEFKNVGGPGIAKFKIQREKIFIYQKYAFSDSHVGKK